MAPLPIFVGYDPDEARAHAVTVRSILRHARRRPVAVGPLAEGYLRGAGVYNRPHVMRSGFLYDAIDGVPLSSAFALSRFAVPFLAGRVANDGWALYCDGDMLFRADVAELFALADPAFAVMVVQHPTMPDMPQKKGGKGQVAYERKNWASLVLWNLQHPANRALTLNDVNAGPGLWLRQFGWLAPKTIGALPLDWNWLAEVSEPRADPFVVHYTLGVPSLPGLERTPFADEWRQLAGEVA